MSCVFPSESVSFACILEIVADVRSGNVNILLARKVLKALDNGLSSVAGEVTLQEFNEKQLANDEAADINFAEVATIAEPPNSMLLGIVNVLESLVEEQKTLVVGQSDSLEYSRNAENIVSLLTDLLCYLFSAV